VVSRALAGVPWRKVKAFESVSESEEICPGMVQEYGVWGVASLERDMGRCLGKAIYFGKGLGFLL
jgi:hypothetical protein